MSRDPDRSTLTPELHSQRDARLAEAASWSADRNASARRSQRIAWIIAAVAVVIALLEALALAALTPLKTVEPYMVLVDRQTGNVETIDPGSRSRVSADDALLRSLLVQYVTARESFDVDNVQGDYRKVALWSAGEARERYIRQMQPGSSESPFATMPRRAVLTVSVRSVSSLSATSALVRFTTQRSDEGQQAQDVQNWASIIHWRFSDAAMTEDDRLLNPLGFQVTRYRRNAETLPEVAAPATSQPTARLVPQALEHRPTGSANGDGAPRQIGQRAAPQAASGVVQ